jgi:DNA invertase Pin-like site-specific DNA recombinase
MVYGYARISTDKQEAERQELDIRRHAEARGLGSVKLMTETVSSRKAERMIFNLVDKLTADDVLLVTELSRLARSMIELNGIIARVIQSGAKLMTVNGDMTIDETIQSQALVFALGIGAQVERDMISQRTISGLRARKAQGVILGRPVGSSKLNDRADEIDKYLKLKVDKANIARIIGCSRGALYAWLKARGKS